MIIILEKFNNGTDDCVKIYENSGKKILDKAEKKFFDTDKDHPIMVVESRLKDYIRTPIPAKVIDSNYEAELVELKNKYNIKE